MMRLARSRFVVFSAWALCCSGVACAQEVGREADDGASTVEHFIDARAQNYLVPVSLSRDRTVQLHARLCRPVGEEPARLVVINHGSPVKPQDRQRVQLGRCEQEAAQWFLHRGYAVAFALRRGYGETGGQDAENVGSCQRPDFVRAGAESAIDVDAVVNYFTGNFAFIRPDSAVVVGQSAGGWAAIAYDSFPHARVSAFINMAGGRGGHRDNLPNDNCRPDLLIDAAEHFGRTATTPMLWIYTKNDSFFAPQLASGLWHAFTRGGGKGDFNQLAAFSTDGHRLFFGHGGSEIWGPIVDRYLK